MENINFIYATNLPEATGDEVSVLCLENGEMKQKPASGLGGGGYILKPTIEELTMEEDVETCTADCSAMVKAIEAGENVLFVFPAGYFGDGSSSEAYVVVGWMVSSGALVGFVYDIGPIEFPNAPIPSFLQE